MSRMIALSRAAVLFGMAFVIRDAAPVYAEDYCDDPFLSCYLSCQHSELPFTQCMNFCGCAVSCVCDGYGNEAECSYVCGGGS